MANRNFYCVYADDLRVSRDWYVNLFGYVADFDSEWFVHLHSPTNDLIELGIMLRHNELVPEAFRTRAGGGMLTIVVDDVEDSYRRAMTAGARIVEPPRDLFYGQRRLLIQDPNNLLVDVSSPCEPDPDWLASLSS